MKKYLFSFLVVLLFSDLSYSQEFNARYGVKFGINGNTLRNDWGLTKRRATGAQYGLVSEFKLKDRFTIQPEVFYSNQRSEGFYNINGETGMVDLEIGYIQVPLMFRYYLLEYLSIQAGPQVGFKTQAKAEIGTDHYYPFGIIQVVEGYDISNKVKAIDAGLSFGLSIDVTRWFFVDTRYTWGLMNTFKPVEGESVQSKNWVFQFTFGIKIPTM